MTVTLFHVLYVNFELDMWCQSCRTDTVQAGVTGGQEMCKEVDVLSIGFMEEI